MAKDLANTIEGALLITRLSRLSEGNSAMTWYRCSRFG